MVKSNSITLYAGGVLLLAFTCTVLGKFNALEQRVRKGDYLFLVEYYF